MKASLKPIANIQSWRLAAIALGSAVALSLATAALAANAPNITSGNTSGIVGVAFSYQMKANQTLFGSVLGVPSRLTRVPSPT